MYVLEYSKNQQCFHVQDLSESLKMGLSDLFRNKSAGYTILFISTDKDILYEISASMKVRNERDRPFTEDKSEHVAKVIAKHHDKLIGFEQ